MDMSKVLDEAKEKLGVESDYGLAKKLGIPNPRISEYRSGKATPDAYACARLADALGVDPLALLAQVEAATEKNEARRNYWRAVSERVGAGIVAGMLIVFSVLPNNSEAQGLDKEQKSMVSNFQNLVRWFAKVKRLLNGLFGQIANQSRYRYA